MELCLLLTLSSVGQNGEERVRGLRSAGQLAILELFGSVTSREAEKVANLY